MTPAGMGSEEGHAARRLERKAPHLIDPFFGLRSMPDQMEFFDCISNRHSLWHEDQSRTRLIRYEDLKVAGHRSYIVGHDNPPEHSAKLQDLRVFHPCGDDVLRQFQIDMWRS
jgi:hypothetical protein